jgi:RHS repeat-associated protein
MEPIKFFQLLVIKIKSLNRALLLSFSLFGVITTFFQTASADDRFPGVKDRQVFTESTSEFGETIDYLRGELSFETVDAVIPGNKGMELVISRSHAGSEKVWGWTGSYGSMANWHFEIPRIIIPTMPWGFTRGWQLEHFDNYFTSDDSIRTGICNDPYPGEGKAYPTDYGDDYTGVSERFWGGIQLKIPGQPAQYLLEKTDSSGRYPANAKWVTTSDWVASCTADGTGFIVKSPNGITYTMDILRANASASGLKHGIEQGKNTLFVSQVADLHGSITTYTYEKSSKSTLTTTVNGNTFPAPNDYNNLTKISRNDPDGEQIIEFDYENPYFQDFNRPNSDWVSIDKITINGREWKYLYPLDSNGDYTNYLGTVIRPDNTYWRYKYEGEMSYRLEQKGRVSRYYGPNRLTKVELPTGGVIDYTYDDSVKLTHDPYDKNMRLETKTINNGITNIDTWVFNYKNHTGNTIKVTLDKGNDSEEFIYKNDKSFQHGRLLSHKLKRVNQAGSETGSKLTEFTYEELAEIGTFTFLDYPEETPDSLTRKVKLIQKKITQDGSIYITDYLDHNLYGQPTKIKEAHGGKTKYTQLGYWHSTNNWLIGLPTTLEISDTDSNYSPVAETIYHNGSSSGGVYDDLGLPYEQKSYGRWVKRFTEYSAEGNLQKEEYNVARTIGSGNRFTQYNNYKRGTPQTITIPAHATNGSMNQSKVIDDNGWVTSQTDLNGVTTNYKYDDLGKIKSVDFAEDTNENIDWKDILYVWSLDDNGNPIRTTKRCLLNYFGTGCSGTVKLTTTETYDGLLRLTNLSEADDTTTRYKRFVYNKNHQQTFASHWSDSVNESKGVTSTFDALGRLELITTSGLGSVEYDYLAGNKIQVTDYVNANESHITTTDYLAYGQPSYEQAIRIDSPESVNVTTVIDIDELGLINSITQSGFQKDGITPTFLVETRLYDANKQLCLVKRLDVGNTLYSKNALGETNWVAEGVSNNTCTTSEPDKAVKYTLDNLGNVKAIDYQDTNAGNVSYIRDNNGNITSLTAGTVVHNYGYNNQNLLEFEMFSIGTEKTLSIDYGYTSMMHQNYIAYPTGSVVYSKPNAFGQPTEVKSYENGNVVEKFASDVNYYPSGQLDSFTYGNDITHKTTLNNASLLPSNIEDLNGAAIVMDLAYTYDFNGNIKSIIDSQNHANDLTLLNYDGLDRLTSTSGGTNIGSSSINYDSLGNITAYSSKNSALDYTYNYSTNRLSSVAGTGSKSKSYAKFDYDTRGNITNNSHDILEFNRANQLYSSGANTYLYDGFNRRVKQVDHSGKISYSMYSQSGTLLYRETDVTNGEGNAINYIHLGNKLIAKTVDNLPPSSSRQHYKPFGATIESSKDDIGFTGHKFDTDLELSYMQARYYDPVIGRFYSNDPVGFSNVHNFNRYTYANNNPYKYVDPDGRHASQKGFYVHQRATYQVIGQFLPKGHNGILVDAQVFADSMPFQTTETAFRHAMSGKGETTTQARSKANTFVREQFSKAWGASSREKALFEFGVALHTLQDATSDSHMGFQQWTGDETNLEIFRHVTRELHNPGEGSNLHKITEQAWGWFESGKLPQGNLFEGANVEIKQ